MKDKISKLVSCLLPNRVVYWVIIRAYAYTTVHSYSDKTPDEIGFGLLSKSWEFKTEHKIDEYGHTKDQR